MPNAVTLTYVKLQCQLILNNADLTSELAEKRCESANHDLNDERQLEFEHDPSVVLENDCQRDSNTSYTGKEASWHSRLTNLFSRRITFDT